MRLKKLWKILLGLLLIMGASFQINAQDRFRCPDYMWKIQYLPVTYLGFEKSPAAVVSTSDGSNEIEGKFPINLGFRNFSDKTVKTLKVEWYLFDKYAYQNAQAKDWETFIKEITLSRGEISIDDTGEFKSKENFEPLIKLPCEEIYDQVGKVDVDEMARKKDELLMEFVVTEISFTDGSTWKRK